MTQAERVISMVMSETGGGGGWAGQGKVLGPGGFSYLLNVPHLGQPCLVLSLSAKSSCTTQPLIAMKNGKVNCFLPCALLG